MHGNVFEASWLSARSVSQSVVRDLPRSSNILTHTFMVWGQFVDHDLDLLIMTWTC